MDESKIIALDISKAFDRVWHPALLSKVSSYGIDSSFITWLSNFLSNRHLRVVIDGVSSRTYPLQAGVPQGSVLSPTLFLLFINDLLSLTENPIFSFADDSTLCHSYSFSKRPNQVELSLKRREMNTSLNSDLEKIAEWGRMNRVEFNAKKTMSVSNAQISGTFSTINL